AEKSIPFVHFSTDYVFPGDGENAWNEEDEQAPLNAYGRSKLAGEEAISHIGGKYLIFRTSWLYDSAGKNFFNTILRLSHEREELRIIDDQFGSPTYVPHLAKAALQALQNAQELPQFPSGIYHLCSGGVTSWYGFACEIIGRAGQFDPQIKTKNIVPILASEYPLPAKRPHNSRLDCSKAAEILGVQMPLWQDGLQECLGLKYSD
ncbi:MAG: sugar nucleotide-binding protein, partial [Pseudomonadota bacterium]